MLPFNRGDSGLIPGVGSGKYAGNFEEVPSLPSRTQRLERIASLLHPGSDVIGFGTLRFRSMSLCDHAEHERSVIFNKDHAGPRRAIPAIL